MTREEIRASVLRILGKIAPEADVEHLEPEVELRRQVDIDSMDFLKFVVAVHESLGVDVPERDYRKLATLGSCVDYIASALAARESGSRPGREAERG